MIEFTDTDLPDVVSMKNVSQVYDNGKNVVLENFNFLIEDKPDVGEFIVILGMSGCGKSTLLRYITGLQKPTAGEVLIYGKQPGSSVMASKVFQKYSSFGWRTVLRNVELPLEIRGIPKKERRERAMEMIQAVGLGGHEHKYAKYPLLSGGQLQRVAIARSLISDPKLLLMDEPFGALDGVTRHQMQMLLLELFEILSPTIIFVTHDIREAVLLADEIYLMSSKPGMIVKHIHVDMPLHREASTMKTARFTELVNEVDDAMHEIAMEAAARVEEK